MQIAAIETVFIAILVLFLGEWLTNKSKFLQKYSIPIPVTAGLLIAVALSALSYFTSINVNFNLSISNVLLLAFYATVGLSARVKLLYTGGKAIIILAVCAGIFLMLQNGLGVVIAHWFHLDPLIGLLGGAISLSGGHGTSLAYATMFEHTYGIANAREIGAAAATFGLVVAGLLGGPLARRLIRANKLESGCADDEPKGLSMTSITKVSSYHSILKTLALVVGCIITGQFVNGFISGSGLVIPDFVVVLFTGVVVVNLLDLTKQFKVNLESLGVLSEVSLNLFLAAALMSLNLVALSGLAVPLLVMLLAQTAFALMWEYWLIFKVMGSDYDAAVIASGDLGFTLGATPTAMANIGRVTKMFGPSPKAYLAIPLVGAFLIDILNALSTQGWLWYLHPAVNVVH